MRLTENQHAVEEFAAQGTYKALADRIHARCLNSGTRDPGPGGLEDGVAGHLREAGCRSYLITHFS